MNYKKIEKTIYIYGLYVENENDKNIKEIRYVGKTNNLKHRLRAHINESLKCKSTHKHRWIAQQIKLGKKIKMCVIEECNENNWAEREIYWISNFENLTNTTSGGEGSQMFHFDISYEDAKSIIKPMNIESLTEWNYKYDNGEIPKSIPKQIREHFMRTNEWIDYADIFGQSYLDHKKNVNNFLSYDEAHKIVSKLNIKNSIEWKKLIREGKINYNIPNYPNEYYKDNGWIDYAHFLSSKHCLSNEDKHNALISYDEAHKLAMSFNIKTRQEWLSRHNNELKKFNAPFNPDVCYSEFTTWCVFLGTSESNTKLIGLNFLSYEDAIIYVKTNMCVKTAKEWKQLVKNNKIPNCLPKSPYHFYNKQHINFKWDEFLSTTDDDKIEIYLSYDESKNILKQYHLMNEKDFNIFKNTPDFPSTITRDPRRYFQKRNTWKNWDDYLSVIKQKNDIYYTYEESKEFLKKFNLKKSKDFETFMSSEFYSKNIPTNPKKYYKKQGFWCGWFDFLSCVKKEKNKREVVQMFTYADCVKYIQENFNISNVAEFRKLVNENAFVSNVPKNPDQYYKKHDVWFGWLAFIGKSKRTRKTKYFASYNECKCYIHENYNIQSRREYDKISNEPSFPDWIPKSPDLYFKKTNEWENWFSYLNKTNNTPKLENYLSYDECKSYIKNNFNIRTREEYRELSKKNLLPIDVPKSPDSVYIKRGTWYGWRQFLRN